ncbi:hypothetical protein PT277_02225 [Acetobacteraceae bacterium ESL0709]|nr:hypothetical protein [Acetobacteraceae bacterium ESL0697]MDF7677519.1 hypothetical protein [Acetobacteraceae bacterium ESL0709]
MLFLCLAGLTGLAGSLLAYLASSHQYLLKKPFPKRKALTGAVGFLILSLSFFLQSHSALTAVFMLTVLLMVLWSLGPLLIAFLQRRRRGS